MVIGASTNPDRYSNICINDLVLYGYPVVAIGLREGNVAGVVIEKGFPEVSDIHTVTLYVGPQNQQPYVDYILHMVRPRRIIFNPGTWNQEFADKARELEIKVESKCTLLMLSGGYY